MAEYYFVQRLDSTHFQDLKKVRAESKIASHPTQAHNGTSMPKQSRRKAAKAKIKAVQEEAEAKAAAAEVEQQRLEEERLREERNRKQVIPLEKCAVLNYRAPCGETKIEMMEVRSLTMRADDAWCYVKEGKDFRLATSGMIGDMVETMKNFLCTRGIELGSFDEEILDVITETALYVLALSRPSDEHVQAELCLIHDNLVSAATRGNETDRLGMRQIAFLLKAAETSHLDTLIDGYNSGGSSWAMCAADTWALYSAIITSHPVIVAAYKAYRRSVVDGLVHLHENSERSNSCLPQTEDEVIDCAMGNLLFAFQCIGVCLPPIIADPPFIPDFAIDKEKNLWTFNEESFGDIILLDTDGPRPDGVTCTNEDPKKCAVCLTASIYKDGLINLDNMNFCCGTIVCDGCSLRTHIPDFPGWLCRFCGQVSGDSGRHLMLSRQSERGRPWAQYATGLAKLWIYEEESRNDATDAMLSLEAAASQGSPDAMMFLSEMLSVGGMVPIDLEKALGLALQALEIEPLLLFDRACAVACAAAMSNVIADPSRLRVNEGIGILTLFLKGGSADANRAFAVMFFAIGSPTAAFRFLERALMCDIANDQRDEYVCDTATFVMKSYIYEGCIPMLQFFYTPLSKLNEMGWVVDDETEPLDELLLAVRDELIRARHSCASCGIGLDASNRKMCKNCRASCYCSRQCQKTHWNRLDGHSHKYHCALVSKGRSHALTEKDAIKGREDLNVSETIEHLKNLKVIP